MEGIVSREIYLTGFADSAAPRKKERASTLLIVKFTREINVGMCVFSVTSEYIKCQLANKKSELWGKTFHPQ